MHRPQILIVLALTCAATFAQTPATDTDKAAAVAELVSMIDPGPLMSQMSNQLRPLVEGQLARTIDQILPKEIDRTAVAFDAQKLQKEIVDRMVARIGAQQKKILTLVYSDLFTIQELRDLGAFYKTPTGQSLLRKMPEISAKSAAAGQQIMMEMIPELNQLMFAWVGEMKTKYGK